MGKIEKAVLKIIENEKELEEFLEQKTTDEMYNFLLKRDNTITKEEFDEDIAKIFKEYDSLVESKEINEEDLKNISGGIFEAAKVLSVLASGLVLVPGLALLKKESASASGVSQITQTSSGRVRQRSGDGGHGRNVRRRLGNDDEIRLEQRLKDLRDEHNDLFLKRLGIGTLLKNTVGKEQYFRQREEWMKERKELMKRNGEVMDEFERTRGQLRALQNSRQ